MKLVFDTERLLLPISTSLQDALNRVISESGKWTPMIQSVVINFRYSSYSSENGGWHRVKSGLFASTTSGSLITSLTLRIAVVLIPN